MQISINYTIFILTKYHKFSFNFNTSMCFRIGSNIIIYVNLSKTSCIYYIVIVGLITGPIVIAPVF